MYQPLTICIGLRYIFKKKNHQLIQLTAGISIIAITLGVMALIVTLSIINGIEQELEHKLLDIIPHVLLTSKTENIDYLNKKNSFLKKIKGIKQITNIVTFEAILQSVNNISIGTILGINPKNSEPLSKFMIYGSMQQLIPKKYNVIIGKTLAEHLNVQIGNNIRIILPDITKITPIGNIPAQRLFQITGIYTTNTNVDSYQLLIHQEDGAHLMHYPNRQIKELRVWLEKPLEIDSFVKQALPKNIFIKKDWREHQGNIFRTIKMEKNMISLLLSSIILISGFNMIAYSCLLITEKKQEIAILKTHGLNTKKIIFLFSIQGTTIGIIGTIFGTLCGYFVAKKINWIISTCNFLNNDKILLPIQIDIFQIIIIIITTISISCLSTLYPAKLAANIDPAKIL